MLPNNGAESNGRIDQPIRCSTLTLLREEHVITEPLMYVTMVVSLCIMLDTVHGLRLALLPSSGEKRLSYHTDTFCYSHFYMSTV